MRTFTQSLSRTTLATAVTLLALPISLAQAQQMQMLPPTVVGTPNTCAGNNTLLFFNNNPGNDSNGHPISAINCLPSNISGPTIDPSTGNLVSNSSATFGTLAPSQSGSGPVQNWGTSLLTVNGNYDVTNWDAYYASTDSMTGKFYQLIGTYHGWDPNSIYIAGYNATNTTPSWGNDPATSVSFGGWGSGVRGVPSASPAMFVDLVNHAVGIGTTAPAAQLDVVSSVNTLNASGLTAPATAVQIETPGTGVHQQSVINMVTYSDGNTLGYANTDLGWQIFARGNAFDTDLGVDVPNSFGISYWNGNSWNEHLRILPSGNIGINTSSPAGTLDVENNTNTAKICLNGSCVSAIGAANIQTTVGDVNAACVASGDPNPPTYNSLQYQVTCASRFCQSKNYVFGLLTEANSSGGWNTTYPYQSSTSEPVNVACTGGTGNTSNGTTVVNNSGPILPTCSAGETLVSNGNGGWACGGAVPNAPTGTPVYMRTASFVGAAAWNSAVDSYVTWCKSSGATFCDTMGASCKLDTAGNDGSAGSVAAYSTTINSVSCQTAVCLGKTNIYPNMVYLNGSCSPGLTPANSGNPGCNANGSPVTGYTCLDSQ